MISATNPFDGAATQTFAYNPIGNLRSNSAVGTYGYPAAGLARPHAVKTAGGAPYSYDDSGNVTVGAGRTLTYDADNRLARVTFAEGEERFGYDAQGRRVKKTGST